MNGDKSKKDFQKNLSVFIHPHHSSLCLGRVVFSLTHPLYRLHPCSNAFVLASPYRSKLLEFLKKNFADRLIDNTKRRRTRAPVQAWSCQSLKGEIA